jgi:hypothetical protein
LLLWIVVAAIVFGLFVQKRRQAELLDRLSLYRSPQSEGIYDALDVKLVWNYPNGAHLDVVLKNLKALTTKNPKLPKLPTGIPIYVDPTGLQDAGVSMGSRVKRPPSADTLTLGEHLERVLDTLGLVYQVKDGFMMLTSKYSLDTPLGEDVKDPYLRYRDVLEYRPGTISDFRFRIRRENESLEPPMKGFSPGQRTRRYRRYAGDRAGFAPCESRPTLDDSSPSSISPRVFSCKSRVVSGQ